MAHIYIFSLKQLMVCNRRTQTLNRRRIKSRQIIFQITEETRALPSSSRKQKLTCTRKGIIPDCKKQKPFAPPLLKAINNKSYKNILKLTLTHSPYLSIFYLWSSLSASSLFLKFLFSFFCAYPFILVSFLFSLSRKVGFF